MSRVAPRYPNLTADAWTKPSSDDGPSSTMKQSRWLDLDEKRLLAYRKGKPWPWIFRKFLGRAYPAIVRAEHETGRQAVEVEGW